MHGAPDLSGLGIEVLGVHHIGIAVRSLAAQAAIYGGMLGLARDGVEEVADQGVRVAFYDAGGTHIELLEPTRADSPVARFLEARGEGMHHLALAVPDLAAALAQLRGAGVRLIDETPRRGARGLPIAFLHPKATGGVLIELCQPDGANA